MIDEWTTIPDKESGWIIPAVLRGLQVIALERPSAIYSSAPPWSGHVVGLLLAKLSGLPWVADFRDPWARAPWRETQPDRIRRASVPLERLVVSRSQAVVFATETNHEEYAVYYGPETSKKFHFVPNGCDPAEFENLMPVRRSPDFVLLHAGSLYGGRTPLPLFRAIANGVRLGTVPKTGFKVRFIGAAVAGTQFAEAAADLGLQQIVEFKPRVPREEILQEMAAASALLVLQPGTTVSIPGKVYEYFAIGRPLLVLCEKGELADLVERSRIGVAVSPRDDAEILRGLGTVMQMQRDGVLPPPPELYDGNRSAERLLAIIKAVVEVPRVSRGA